MLICHPLWTHDVAGGSAESSRIHVADAFIGKDTDDEQIGHGGQGNDDDGMADGGTVQVNLRVYLWDLAGLPELATAQVDTERNHG